jgi:ribonuclease P protein component
VIYLARRDACPGRPAAAALPAAPRLGLTVSRRVAGAVLRNRLKRRLRECFRLTLRPLLPRDTDLVVIARRGAADLPSAALCAELTAAVKACCGAT